MIDTSNFPVYKGLQKPLEFMGIRGRFLIYGAFTIGLSFLSYIGGYILIGKLGGFISMISVIGVGLIIIFVKQKRGLHNKKRNKGLFVFKSLIKH